MPLRIWFVTNRSRVVPQFVSKFSLKNGIGSLTPDMQEAKDLWDRVKEDGLIKTNGNGNHIEDQSMAALVTDDDTPIHARTIICEGDLDRLLAKKLAWEKAQTTGLPMQSLRSITGR